jgi:hypothetical protein
MAEHPTTPEINETPYEKAHKAAEVEYKRISKIADSIDTRASAYALISILEQKFGFWCITTSTDDLKIVMQELGVHWFSARGYTQADGEELKEVPEITEALIEELGLDLHPWREIEEDVYGHITDGLRDTIESMFPDKS